MTVVDKFDMGHKGLDIPCDDKCDMGHKGLDSKCEDYTLRGTTS